MREDKKIFIKDVKEDMEEEEKIHPSFGLEIELRRKGREGVLFFLIFIISKIFSKVQKIWKKIMSLPHLFIT